MLSYLDSLLVSTARIVGLYTKIIADKGGSSRSFNLKHTKLVHLSVLLLLVDVVKSITNNWPFTLFGLPIGTNKDCMDVSYNHYIV